MPDVNVLVYAHRQTDVRHPEYAQWLTSVVGADEPFALSVLVAASFVRVATMPALPDPSPLPLVLAFVDELMNQPNCRIVSPGAGHLDHFARLCRAVDARGNLVANAQHAAVAIENGCVLVSADDDFARFAPHGLRWQHLSL